MKKKWLWVIGLAALVIPIVALTGCFVGVPGAGGAGWTNVPSLPQVNVGGQQEGIWVSGEGKVTAVPDLAIVVLGIEAQAATVAEAQTQASEAMGRVMTALEDNGVAEKDIQTQYFNVYQRTQWDEIMGEEVVIGYQVSNMVTTKIRDIDNAGLIIDAVVTAGGDLTRINSINFSIDDPSVYLDEMREEAMADAKDRAEQLAQLAGVKLGKPIYISESSYLPYPEYPRVYYEGGMAPPAAPPPISPGEMEITLNVQIAYAILD